MHVRFLVTCGCISQQAKSGAWRTASCGCAGLGTSWHVSHSSFPESQKSKVNKSSSTLHHPQLPPPSNSFHIAIQARIGILHKCPDHPPPTNFEQPWLNFTSITRFGNSIRRLIGYATAACLQARSLKTNAKLTLWATRCTNTPSSRKFSTSAAGASVSAFPSATVVSPTASPSPPEPTGNSPKTVNAPKELDGCGHAG